MDIQRPSRKKQIQRRRLLMGLGLIAVLSLITWGLSSLEPALREVKRAELYIRPVVRGEMLRSVRGPGTLVPTEIRWLAAETNGRVERFLIEPGAVVEADTIIMELSNPELERDVRDAELQLRAAEAEYQDLRLRLESNRLAQEAELERTLADYESAELQLEADQTLFKDGLVPNIQLKRSELTTKQLKGRTEKERQRLDKIIESNAAQLRVKRNDLAQKKTLYELRAQQLLDLQLRAGIRGVLQEVPVEIGQRVSPGTNLARVAQPDRLKAELRINETQAKDITVGQVALIDTRNGEIEGRVSRIDPAVQQGSVTVDVRLVGELPRGARPDLSVDGTIEIERLEDVLYVTRPVYGQANSTVGLFVLTADGATAARRQVRLGRSSFQTIEVIDGLLEGDQVILSDTSSWDQEDRIRITG